MFCFIYKWMISWALDSGKKLPGAVNRHIGRCSGCCEFARLSGSLASRLTRDAPGFLQTNHDTHDTLNIKIKSVLDGKSSPKLTPGRRFNFRPIPTMAAALLVLAVAIGVIFQVIPLTGPRPGENSFNELSESALVKNPLQVIQQVESPIESEMRSLEQSFNSAAEFLVSCLDVKIGLQ